MATFTTEDILEMIDDDEFDLEEGITQGSDDEFELPRFAAQYII